MATTTIYNLPAVEVGDEKTPYLYEPRLPGCWVLTSPKGEVYTLAVSAGGGRTCSCPNWYFRRRFDGSDCKHLEAAAGAGLIAPAEVPAG